MVSNSQLIYKYVSLIVIMKEPVAWDEVEGGDRIGQVAGQGKKWNEKY